MRYAENEQLFTEADLEKATCKLNKMLITVFIDNKITRRDFIILHKKYLAENITILPKSKITTDRGNLIRRLVKVDIPYTYSVFILVLRDILKLNLVKMECTFMDSSDVVKKYTSETVHTGKGVTKTYSISGLLF